MKSSRNRRSSFHPLLPSFSARLIIAFRTLVGIACCATLSLSPRTSNSIQGQLLLGISFIVAMKNTLGATIQCAKRLIIGGGIATSYCLLIIHFCPRNVYFAVGATNIFVLFIVYTDLPVIVRRFSIVPCCIILLQWFSKDHINRNFILQIWLSLSIGSMLACLVTSIPLPKIPTAYRELEMRMKFLCEQSRREITAIILLISEYHQKHFNDNFDQREENLTKSKRKEFDEYDEGIEMILNSSSNVVNDDQSFEIFKDDHLLKSDIEDLHSLLNDEIKQIQRALTEISNEPFFVFLKFLNLIRRFLLHIPLIKGFIKSPSTLKERLILWVNTFVSLQRTITSLLTLDHHHHTFVGQRQLINSICSLLENTFYYFDSVLLSTIESNELSRNEEINSRRIEIENSLENFFEIYSDIRCDPHHEKMSNNDSIRLNTFLLLILRLVHLIITGGETSETLRTTKFPQDSTNEISSNWKTKFQRCFSCQKLFQWFSNYIGLRPSKGKLIRSVKTSLSVLISAIVVITLKDRIQAYGWIYWAPMTTALVSDSSEGGTLRLSFQRLMAVLLGSTYAYVVVLVTQNHLAVGILISLFVALMGYLKTDARREYFASVCAQSASIITFLSNQQGQMNPSNKAVLARTSLTFLGIFIHVLISNLFFPITARALIKKKIRLITKNIRLGLNSSIDEFCSFIRPSETKEQENNLTKKIPINLTKILGETEKLIDGIPSLLDEALNEPNFWKRPFIQVKDRYAEIGKSLRQISFDIRFIHRCTIILKAESKLHFAQEAKWQVRRFSLLPANVKNWTINELKKEKQIIKDLDIPLTIFQSRSRANSSTTTNPIDENENVSLFSSKPSSIFLRLANPTLYEPVIEHIRRLEKQIERVIELTEELIEKQATIDVGSLEFHQLYREDSSNQLKREENHRPIIRGPSIYMLPEFETIPMLSNPYKFFSCCQSSKEDKESLPSLRNQVDLMFSSLIQFLSANNRFIRHEFVSNQAIGDVLAFHTLSYAFKDMVEATTNIALNARRIKHINTRKLNRNNQQ